jgi:hypothetical protein
LVAAAGTAADAVLPPVVLLIVASFGVILVVIGVSIVVGIVVLMSMLLSRALAAIDATISLASIVAAAIVVATAATTTALPAALSSAQQLQRLLPSHLLQPLPPSLPLPPLSPWLSLSPSLPPPPQLLRPCPLLHCHHCCSLCRHHHTSNPINGWLFYRLPPFTFCIILHTNFSAPAVLQSLMLSSPGYRPLLPTTNSCCPVALAPSIYRLCHSR